MVNGKNKEIDARPSDAIAIGLRFNASIYTTEAIMSEAGIVLSDYTDEEPKKTKKTSDSSSKVTSSTKIKVDKVKDMSVEQLKISLSEALLKEDYEVAASIRDELNKRN